MEGQALQPNSTDARASSSQGAMPFSLSSGTETKCLSKYSWDLEFRHFKGGGEQLAHTLERWDQRMEWRKGRVVTATTIRTVLPRWGVLPGTRWLEPRVSSLQGLREQVGRCLAAGLEMTEQPVCPGCQSGRRWWGRGVRCLCSKPCFFPLCLSLSRLCSPALRQLILPDGSGSARVESPCLEAGRGWPWRPDGSTPLSRPSHKPLLVGNLWAAGLPRCLGVGWGQHSFRKG